MFLSRAVTSKGGTFAKDHLVLSPRQNQEKIQKNCVKIREIFMVIFMIFIFVYRQKELFVGRFLLKCRELLHRERSYGVPYTALGVCNTAESIQSFLRMISQAPGLLHFHGWECDKV